MPMLNVYDIFYETLHDNILTHYGETSFVITLNTHVFEEGQKAWLTKHIKIWEEHLRNEYGVQSFEITSITQPSQVRDGLILCTLTIPGSLVKEKCNQHMFPKIETFVTKYLADLVLSFCEPSFDYREPLFLAKETYSCRFSFSNSSANMRRVEEVLNNSEALEEILNNHFASLHEHILRPTYSVVRVQWATDVSAHALHDVKFALYQYYFSNGFLVNW